MSQQWQSPDQPMREDKSGDEGKEWPRRVCDNCIRKKTRCDRLRPTCSRCSQRGEPCTYSSSRRKPGPPQGSHYKRTSPQSRSSGRRSRNTTPESSTIHQVSIPSGFSSSTSLFPEFPYETSSIDQSSTGAPRLSPQHEEYLLEKYFDIVQDANPIFSRAKFLQEFRNSLCNKDLVLTIAIITAKLIGFNSFLEEPTLNARIDRLLRSSLLQDDMVGDSPSLDQFRKACVLAFYEFHQFPGHQSWKRIGSLTRLAYRIGLDRLESLRTLYPDWGCLSQEDLQEWRSVWWCVYRLDTYSNLSAGTPFLIENDFINTSLVLDPSTSFSQELYLPPDTEDLWKLLPTITAHPQTSLKNIHIISIAATRRAGLVARAHLSRPNQDITTHLRSADRHLSTLCLSLPPGWFNPRRNAFSNESHSDYYQRLITVLHLRMARLLISIIGCGRQGDEWAMYWQRVLETCQDISSIITQWDSSFCTRVDPAISFITFTALVFFDLHKKSMIVPVTAMPAHDIYASIEHDQNVLRLQLEQFAKLWTLPRLLSLSFASFSESISGPLCYRRIAMILARFEAPLNPRWLQFLSSAQAVFDFQ